MTKISIRALLFVVFLSAIILSLFGGLVVANEALSEADRESARLDAHASALVAERELQVQATALSEKFDPLLTASRRTAIDTMTPKPFVAVWVLDPRGAIVGRGGGSTLDDADVRATASAATAEPRATVVRGPGQPATILLSVALTHRGQRLGTAVGQVRPEAILGAISDTALSRNWLRLRGTGATIGSLGESSGGASFIASAPIRIAGDPLFVDISHSQGGRVIRTVLWFLGAAGVIALIVALMRERQQTLQLAGRTAELERLYQEVARSNRMKSEFLANVSHELRTPLNAVVGFVEMLRDGVYGEITPRQAVPVERISASSAHLRQMVDRLLDIAKIAAGRLEVHVEPLVLRPFILDITSEMESLANERGLALTVDIPANLPRLETDQTHLRQIVINLIGNAVKYTPSGGITVDAAVEQKDEHSWIALRVKDTGVGIAAEDLERIFDEFEQVNAGARTDSARRGTGLGLAISRRLARLINGELTVASEVGHGSAFTVWLPLDKAADAAT
jgi:signal transduction histidine kinase